MSSGLLNALRHDGPAKPEHPSRRRLWLGAAAVVAVAVLLTWIVAFSPVLGVRTVTVHGTRTVSAGQVEAAAHIKHGTPLVRLDTAAVAHRVEALRDIASARVTTSFPSTVVITVTEREPVGYVKRTGGYALVDATGYQYRVVNSPPARLPLFVVPSGTDARTTGGAVATVASALSPALRRKVASIQALDPQAITLLLKDGRVVRWGGPDRSTEKARVVAALLPRTGQQIDVTDPSQPFTR